MQENERLKKFSIGYFVLYIFVPIVVGAICFTIMGVTKMIGYGAVALAFGPVIFAILWWVILGTPFYNMRTRKMENELDATGFYRNQTFNADGCVVIVDRAKGNMAILFRWNPMKYYVFPASRLTKIWVDDGKTGAGIFAGSGRVSFLFLVDDIKVRVNTFTSNRRWAMEHEYILEGISKADMMAEILSEAKAASEG